MGRIKRGGYIFVRWEGDHDPPHIHVYRDNNFIVKVELLNFKVIEGDMNSNIFCILLTLRKEGKL